MEQRRLRLGDILDDYCPRERRVTNHAIVAMIEDDIKQTRCTTCDAEHVYKGGKAPRRRKKDTPGALYKEVLAGMPEAEAAPVLAAPAAAADARDRAANEVDDVDDAPEPLRGGEAPSELAEAAESGDEDAVPHIDEGPVHRPLIRATLPRPEGQKDARPLPEFTIRQANRPGNAHFRGARAVRGQSGAAGANGNGNRAHGPRFHGGRAGQGRPASGGRSEGRGGHGGGFKGRKRSR